MTKGEEFLCSRCWFRHEGGRGFLGWRRTAVWSGWAMTFSICVSVVVLYYTGTGNWAWALVLSILLSLALSAPLAFWAGGKRNWKLLGSIYLVALGGWFLLWKAVPGVGWSDTSFVTGAGLSLVFIGIIMLAAFMREMAKIPKR